MRGEARVGEQGAGVTRGASDGEGDSGVTSPA